MIDNFILLTLININMILIDANNITKLHDILL